MNIATELFRAIHQSRWLQVKYKNNKGETTFFWMAIKDIIPDKKMFFVDVYNSEYNPPFQKDFHIYYENIKTANVIDNTFYEVPQSLVDAMEKNPQDYTFLKSNRLAKNVLDYYEQMLQEDNDPIQKDFTLIEHIDLQVLKDQATYPLNETQFKRLIEFIKKTMKASLKHRKTHVKLALNLLSIKTNRGLYALVYQELTVDIERQCLVLAKDISYNYTVLDENQRSMSLGRFLPMSLDAFKDLYEEDALEAHKVIEENLLPYELLDERPYILTLTKDFKQNYHDQYQAVIRDYEEDRLSLPLKSFFGLITKRNTRRKSKPILPLSNRVNLDQLRVMHNAVSQPVTFVQGPPGTGKTETILNTIISLVFNRQTVLITSQNNHPINSVKDALWSLHYQDKRVYFPLLRLGNNEVTLETLKAIKENYEYYEKEAFIEKKESLEIKVPFDQDQLSNALAMYDEFDQLTEEKEALNAIKSRLGAFAELRIQPNIDALDVRLKSMILMDNDTIVASIGAQNETLLHDVYHFSVDSYRKLDRKKHELLKALIIEPEKHNESTLNAFNKFIREDEGLKKLLEVFPVILSTNPSAVKLGSPRPQFDCVIIDEASQCNPATALLPIMRGERLMLVGDSNQLQPITNVTPKTNEHFMKHHQVPLMYDYTKKSILNLMLETDTISRSVLLKYHYRSVEPIIQFSNQKYYMNRLEIKTAKGQNDSLKLIDVPSHEQPSLANASEVDKVIQEIKANPNQSIGVIAPFRKQVKQIENALLKIDHPNVTVGTVHSFQGDQKDKIIFSLGLSSHTHDKAFTWVQDNHELLNVAVTRAKHSLCLVGDVKEIIKRAPDSDLYELTKYIKRQGDYVLDDKTPPSFYLANNRTKPLHSKYEEEFLETLSHYVELSNQFILKEKMGVKDVIRRDDVSDSLLDYYFKAHFDFVLYDKITKVAVLAIELNGPSHLTARQSLNDQKKQDIVKQSNSGLKLLSIPNTYVRRYETIRNAILEILRG